MTNLAPATTRPVARTYFTSPLVTAPRAPAASKPFGVVKAPAPIVAMVKDEPAGTTDDTIRLLEEASTKMVDALQRLRAHDEIVADLQRELAELRMEKDLADEAARTHETRAYEAQLEVHRLQTEMHEQREEHARVKVGVDRLLAIFGTEIVAA